MLYNPKKKVAKLSKVTSFCKTQAQKLGDKKEQVKKIWSLMI